MTKTVKESAEKATKTTEATQAKVLQETTAKLTEGTEVARDLVSALTESGRKTFEGVLAFDKALLGIVKESITAYVDHGKATLQARSINDVVDLQAAYAHSAIEATAANTRELLDLAKTKTEEAVAPLKEVVAELKSDKKAA